MSEETTRQNYEWHRERALRQKKSSGQEALNRMAFNVKAVEKQHGKKAAQELLREIGSK